MEVRKVYDILVSVGWVSSGAAETPALSFGTVLAFGSLIGMPIIFAAIGFVAGFIEANLYYLFVGRFGGLEIDIH